MFMDSSPIPSMSTYSNSMNQVFEGGGQTISHRPLSQQRYLSGLWLNVTRFVENTFAYRNPALPRIDDMHMNSFGYSLPYQSLNDLTPSSRIHDQFYSGTPLTMNHLSFHSEEMPQYNRFLRQPDDQFPSFDDSTRYLFLPRDPDSSSSVLSYPPPSLSPSFSKPYSVGAQDFSTVNGSVSHSHSAYCTCLVPLSAPAGSPYAVSYQETCLTPSLDTDTLVSSSSRSARRPTTSARHRGVHSEGRLSEREGARENHLLEGRASVEEEQGEEERGAVRDQPREGGGQRGHAPVPHDPQHPQQHLPGETAGHSGDLRALRDRVPLSAAGQNHLLQPGLRLRVAGEQRERAEAVQRGSDGGSVEPRCTWNDGPTRRVWSCARSCTHASR